MWQRHKQGTKLFAECLNCALFICPTVSEDVPLSMSKQECKMILRHKVQSQLAFYEPTFLLGSSAPGLSFRRTARL